MRTTSHTRVGGRAEVSVGGRDDRGGDVKRSTCHIHTHTQRTTPPHRHTHIRQEQHPKPANEHPPQKLNNARRWRDDGAGLVV